MSSRARIVFLDIDGVLASARSWILPQNAEIVEKLSVRELHHAQRKELALAATFDPCAVALINRLCRVAGARIVIHSNWRRNIGRSETHAKLIEQGIQAEHFHDDPICSMRISSEKIHDIGEWLSDNRLTKEPKRPKSIHRYPPITDKKAAEAEKVYWEKFYDYGIDFVVIDDDYIGASSRNFPLVQTDFSEGFTVQDYRIACAALGASDQEMGVHPVSDQDQARVLSAFENNVIDAVKWLHGTEHGRFSRAKRLDAEYQKNRASPYYTLGYGADPDTQAMEMRNQVIEELKAVEAAKAERIAEHERWLADHSSTADF